MGFSHEGCRRRVSEDGRRFTAVAQLHRGGSLLKDAGPFCRAGFAAGVLEFLISNLTRLSAHWRAARSVR